MPSRKSRRPPSDVLVVPPEEDFDDVRVTDPFFGGQWRPARDDELRSWDMRHLVVARWANRVSRASRGSA